MSIPKIYCLLRTKPGQPYETYYNPIASMLHNRQSLEKYFLSLSRNIEPRVLNTINLGPRFRNLTVYIYKLRDGHLSGIISSQTFSSSLDALGILKNLLESSASLVEVADSPEDYVRTKIERVKERIEEVKVIMADNIQLAIARGEKIHDLDDKAQELAKTADKFMRKAHELNKGWCPCFFLSLNSLPVENLNPFTWLPGTDKSGIAASEEPLASQPQAIAREPASKETIVIESRPLPPSWDTHRTLPLLPIEKNQLKPILIGLAVGTTIGALGATIVLTAGISLIPSAILALGLIATTAIIACIGIISGGLLGTGLAALCHHIISSNSSSSDTEERSLSPT